MGNVVANHKQFALLQRKAFGGTLEERLVVEAEVFAVGLVDDVVESLQLAVLDHIAHSLQCDVLGDDFVVGLVVLEQPMGVLRFVVDKPLKSRKYS